MKVVALLLCALATFRLAEMLVIDDGPFDVLINIRGWLGRPPLVSMSLRGLFAGTFSCVHCAGIWIAFVFALFFSTSISDFILFWFAIAGLQSIMANKLGRKA